MLWYMQEIPAFDVDLESYRSNVERLGRMRASAKHLYDSYSAQLRDAIISAADAGVSENELSRISGVDRQTLRRWRGKTS